MSAVVDTAAKITIIFQMVYDQMSRQEIIATKDVNLAEGGGTLYGGCFRGCTCRHKRDPGQTSYECCSIQVDMLIGIDFLQENQE